MSKKVHFIGLCGVGMSGVAKMLKDGGWDVTGSDMEIYPPVSDFLMQEGLECLTPHAAANIPADVERIVIGKHAGLVPETNEEVARAFELKEAGQVEIMSYPDVLNELTAGRHSIVVVGSYGKSTTTSLLAWMLADNGQDPSYFIGAVPLNLSSGSHVGGGEYFVLEGDEYPAANWDDRSKFLLYRPRTVILTSGEYDHFKEFATEQDYVGVYFNLVRNLPADGLLVACLDGAHVAEILLEASCRVVTYSTNPARGADWTVKDATYGVDGSFITFVKRDTGEMISVHTTLLGEHNAQNILGAIVAMRELNVVTAHGIKTALTRFESLKRRLEQKALGTSVQVYEDFAASRAKVMASLRAIRLPHPDSRVIVAFQPHTFSFRSRQALAWYPGMFADANEVIVFSPPSLHGLASEKELSYEEICSAIKKGNSCRVLEIGDTQGLVRHLEGTLHPGDIVVLMTTGAMDGAIEAVSSMVEKNFPSSV
jgi:UDP-N-acetylmuramate: L-alanyl-gamma-D-glutamyl-meso-diaminopimelate ligase